MKTLRITLILVISLLAASINPVIAQAPEQLYQKGLMKETGEGLLQDAISLYSQVADNSEAGESLRAKALLHIGRCYEKMGKDEATKAYQRLVNNFPDSVFISAKTGEGIDKLNGKIEEFIQKSKKCVELEIPIEMQSLILFLHKNAEIIENKYKKTTNSQTLKLKISRQLLEGIKKQIKDFKLLKFINNK